jgi:hypothetical protein
MIPTNKDKDNSGTNPNISLESTHRNIESGTIDIYNRRHR